MNRREAIRSIALSGAGATALPGWATNLLHLARRHGAGRQPGQTPATPATLTAPQHDLVVTLAELIIPRTDTAGATDAGVAAFVDNVLSDAPEAERDEFLAGLAWIDERSRASFGTEFVDAGDERQRALLSEVSSPSPSIDAVGTTFFETMKQLTVTGYYTSEAGRREELGIGGNVFFADDPGCLHPEHKS